MNVLKLFYYRHLHRNIKPPDEGYGCRLAFFVYFLLVALYQIEKSVVKGSKK